MLTSVCFPTYRCALFYRDASWLIPPLLTIKYRGATGRQPHSGYVAPRHQA